MRDLSVSYTPAPLLPCISILCVHCQITIHLYVLERSKRKFSHNFSQSTVLQWSQCSVIQLKWFFSWIQTGVSSSGLSPDQRRGGAVKHVLVTERQRRERPQQKNDSVPSLPSGPATVPTANERSIFGLTQIMFFFFLLGPKHNYCWCRVRPVVSYTNPPPQKKGLLLLIKTTVQINSSQKHQLLSIMENHREP